ncbi:uncharacterized protein LOC112198760 [Rosa chinensis]|uniref:uncharacterized protein LOC112198760 n=1 Tax=Rosa chinensis TaxID=74649 RepID=UPI000D08718E|nr:uncharacterized protein LOC112198760 [Rosa chinensis]
MVIHYYRCHKVLVDSGAAVSVMFGSCYEGLNRDRKKLSPDHEPLISLAGEITQPLGSDNLRITLGGGSTIATMAAQFITVDCLSSYNVILRRDAIWGLQCFVEGHMLMMKIPTPSSILTIRGNQELTRQCNSLTVARGHGRREVLLTSDLPSPSNKPDDLREDLEILEDRDNRNKKKDNKRKLKHPRPDALEDLISVSISDTHPERKVKIGSKIDPQFQAELIAFLKTRQEVFSWSYADMPGISPDLLSPDLITHKLTISPDVPPIQQKRRAFTEEKYKAIQAEVKKLQDIGFIREVSYPTWLSNVVMVKKPNEKWRMCVNYTNLKKACPNNSFPLQRIDKLVDSTAGHKLLSFMDAFSGYNQIAMEPSDQEHTSFTTDKGLYYYRVMPFGLKNAGAMYQRLVNAMFSDHIGKIIEVYVDDMHVKRVTI